MENSIVDILAVLDPENEDQWTEDGQPVLKVVADLLGNPDVTRKEITEAWPEFSQELAIDLAAKAEDTPPEVPEVDALDEGEGKIEQQLGKEEDVDETIGKLEEVINRLGAQKSKLDEEILHHTDLLEGLQRKKFGNSDHTSDTAARLNYIRSQNKLRASRAEVSAALLQGIDKSKLDPRSPIDQAMARKSQRGDARPTGGGGR